MKLTGVYTHKLFQYHLYLHFILNLFKFIGEASQFLGTILKVCCLSLVIKLIVAC